MSRAGLILKISEDGVSRGARKTDRHKGNQIAFDHFAHFLYLHPLRE
jgi:hypothetical protein